MAHCHAGVGMPLAFKNRPAYFKLSLQVIFIFSQFNFSVYYSSLCVCDTSCECIRYHFVVAVVLHEIQGFTLRGTERERENLTTTYKFNLKIIEKETRVWEKNVPLLYYALQHWCNISQLVRDSVCVRVYKEILCGNWTERMLEVNAIGSEKSLEVTKSVSIVIFRDRGTKK